MASRKKRSLKALGAALTGNEKNQENRDLNGFKRLCAAYVGTGDERQRERAIRRIVRQETGLAEMLRQNDAILIATAERALAELALGCTVTERRIRTSPQGRTVEEVVKQLPPNQAALEFFLTNRNSEKYSKNPETKPEDDRGRIAELVEVLKSVKS
ncbi:MAG: hypothetical protein NC084_09725 [Bacteroides sp.]|nr:hypothetical protein [Roseburia sp.]MCM1462976.1 hypothetical protein [Bacteroides sp.]